MSLFAGAWFTTWYENMAKLNNRDFDLLHASTPSSCLPLRPSVAGVPQGQGPRLVRAELLRGAVLSPVAAVVLGAPPRNDPRGHTQQGQVHTYILCSLTAARLSLPQGVFSQQEQIVCRCSSQVPKLGGHLAEGRYGERVSLRRLFAGCPEHDGGVVELARGLGGGGR